MQCRQPSLEGTGEVPVRRSPCGDGRSEPRAAVDRRLPFGNRDGGRL